jgi:hypothetical protein
MDAYRKEGGLLSRGPLYLATVIVTFSAALFGTRCQTEEHGFVCPLFSNQSALENALVVLAPAIQPVTAVPARRTRTFTSTREPSRLRIEIRRSTVNRARVAFRIGRGNTSASVRCPQSS